VVDVIIIGSGLRYHFSVTFWRDVWPSYWWAYDLVTCPRAALARLPRVLWTRWTIAVPLLRVIVSHATRVNSQTCRPRAVIGRQRLSLRSSRQWARTAQLSPVRGRVTDRAVTTTVRALRQPSGLWETTPGARTTLTGEDAEAAGSERRGGFEQPDFRNGVAVPFNEVAARPVRRYPRWAVGVAAGLTGRQPSHRLWQGSTPLGLLYCACCSVPGDRFSSLCSSPFCVNSF